MGARKHPSETVTTRSFKDLKKLMTQKRSLTAARDLPAQKKRVSSDDELFLEEMKQVNEIEEFRMIPIDPPAASPGREKVDDDRDALKALEDLIDGRSPVHLPDTQEYVEWIDPDFRKEIALHMHQGRYSVQDFLDLHGAIVEEAEKEIEDFIEQSRKKGLRCIKIIHGRGLCSPKGPVLKDIVINRLSRKFRKYVAAFVTARQCDGGLGALYVLLK